MKRENLWLFINTGIMLVVGIIVILLAQFIVPKDPEDRLFNRVINLENQVNVEGVPNQSSFSTIDFKADAVALNGTVLGTVYNVKIKNSYNISPDYDYGMIELLIGIGTDDRVYVQIVELNQSSWTVKGIQKYITTFYQGVTLEEVEKIVEYDAADLSAGATAVDSTGSIKSLVVRTLQLHFNIQTDPYVAMFGAGYTKSIDASFQSSGYVSSREIAKDATGNEIGYLYRLNGSSLYNDETGASGDITLYVGVDQAGLILGIVAPQTEYNHSKGGFYNQAMNYIMTYVGKSIFEIDDSSADITAGATNSKTLMVEMLAELKGVN